MTPGQREFRGLTFGPESDIKIVEEDGLEVHTVRDGDRAIPRDDGSIPGLHLAESKVITLELLVLGDTVDATTADLLAAFIPSRTGQFQYRFVNLDGVESFIWARPLRAQNKRTNETEHANRRPVMVALKAADPRIYSVEVHQVLVPEFGASGGGAEFPNEFPFGMGASAQQLATAVNQGSRDAYPRVIVQPTSGTMTSVTLTNLTNGDEVQVDTSVTAGQQLLMDFDALIRSTGDPVIAIGGSSRYGDWVLPRDPFRLSPGSNSLKLEQTGASEVTCLVTWRSTD